MRRRRGHPSPSRRVPLPVSPVRDTHTPGYFAERVWTCLIAKELGFLPTTKSPQEYANNGVERLKRLHREFGRKLIPPTPRATQMIIKGKDLREKRFVTI